MAGGKNKATTPLPAWMTEANRARREEQLARRPERQVHCWVLTSAGECPGLVIDWRREGAGWAALAVWTTGTATFVHAWVDAEQVRPAVVITAPG